MFEAYRTHDACPYGAGGGQASGQYFYTAPTAIRALMAEGDKAIEGTDRSSLRILGSVGEPINPEAWGGLEEDRQEMPGGRHRWQTETGGFMITPLRRYRVESRFGNTSVLRRATGAGR